MTSMTRRCFLRGAVATPALIAGTRAARAEDDRLFSAWEGGEIGNALFRLALSPREGLRNTRLTHSSGLVLADGANFQLEINPGDLVELEKNAALDVGLKTLGLDFEVIGADGKAGQIVEAFRIRLSRPRRAAVTSCPSSLLAGTKSVAARSVSSVRRFETWPHNAVWSFIRVLSFGLIEIPRADADYPSQQLNSLELSPSDRYLSIGFFPENIHYCYYSGRASLCLQPLQGAP